MFRTVIRHLLQFGLLLSFTIGAAVPAPPAEWRDLVRDGVGEGLRNQTVTRLAGYLLRRRVDPLVALELLSTTAGASLRSALSSLPLSSTASPAAS